MSLDHLEEWQKAQRGELYLAFTPELIAARDRTNNACNKFNNTTDTSRRNLVRLWREITQDPRPLPPPPQSTGPVPSPDRPDPANQDRSNISKDGNDSDDEKNFINDPWVLPSLHADYGFNIHLSDGVFLNFNATFVDTCPITIGPRTLIGPNCSFYSGTHPLDPAVRMGTQGPESGKPITIGADCWLGGNVIVLPGVSIGRGCTIGAGSVVTRDVPAFHVAAGNPARVLRRIESVMDSSSSARTVPAGREEADGPEVAMAQDAAATSAAAAAAEEKKG